MDQSHNPPSCTDSTWQVFLIFLRLGLTSFGGPVAHLGFFREEFVARRKWMSDHQYADLVALCQFLPGPASSQVGLALGMSQRGYRGAMAAWLGFTMPSAIFLVAAAYGFAQADSLSSGLLSGLKIAAVAVVAQAVWSMAPNLCPDRPRQLIMLLAAAIVLMLPIPAVQLGVLLLAAGAGFLLPAAQIPAPAEQGQVKGSWATRKGARLSAILLALFVLIFFMLPVVANATGLAWLNLADIFYRTGALVFGGGHVVLPLLQTELVPTGWISEDLFLAGYGLTQAVPGPLFTFSAFVGAAANQPYPGWLAALVCLLAIFLPSFLLVGGILPYWEKLRQLQWVRQILLGVNAAVVGLLLAALYQPVWTSAISGQPSFVLLLLACAALFVLRLPVWLVVIAMAGAGAVFLG
ncbi:chromate transporter [Pseudohongiella nitratireducens]|uniref:Chromate transporter n=1 Tax=Pseudohongiella nitratireducens TaxID=1768907 RepID=A0A917LUX5_9GAMM|nr:chromate efflux transporter [Pseudohongiella nitratireducens]MDF1623830.1 chromate efflux transporter [Pseudohongiella nitratireducens]GGG58475.1 chromate transporter [Pseudohongiella nitratireducens]|tara:strand:- start:5189 stop:6412 length:1224 start_codon:yes stop_codon:yes gene_type:complete